MQNLEDVTPPNHGLGVCTRLMRGWGSGLGVIEELRMGLGERKWRN